MTKKQLKEIKVGDVLLVDTGKLIRITEIADNFIYITDLSSESNFFDYERCHLIKNLGQSNEVLITFYTTRSIHLRLNIFKGV